MKRRFINDYEAYLYVHVCHADFRRHKLWFITFGRCGLDKLAIFQTRSQMTIFSRCFTIDRSLFSENVVCNLVTCLKYVYINNWIFILTREDKGSIYRCSFEPIKYFMDDWPIFPSRSTIQLLCAYFKIQIYYFILE